MSEIKYAYYYTLNHVFYALWITRITLFKAIDLNVKKVNDTPIQVNKTKKSYVAETLTLAL